MPWMKLDDKFHASDKLHSIPKRHRFQAAGLWAIAGSWVAGQETDGFVPDYMIQAWRPTDATVESLVNARLWERVQGGYRFYSWLKYNPSKEDSDRERAASRERMRASRERKKAKRAGREAEEQNVAAQHPDMLQRNTPEVLQRPDPTRPDPTRSMGKESQPTYGDLWETEDGGGLTLDGLADATRRARDAGIPETAIAAGTREFNRRPEPKGPGLLRTLINDAAKAEHSTQARDEAKAKRRAAIDACNQCDDNGYVKVANGTVAKCTHQPMKGPF